MNLVPPFFRILRADLVAFPLSELRETEEARHAALAKMKEMDEAMKVSARISPSRPPALGL